MHEKLWNSVLSELEIQLSKPNFLTWFKNSQLLDKTEDGEIIIALGNNFAKEWVENKYNKIIYDILTELDNSIRKVKYTVLSNIPAGGSETKITEAKKEANFQAQAQFEAFKVDPESNLHPKYSFKSYIVGSSNELAFAAAQAVIKDVGTKYNPLFIYGGTGLGKTHLLQALGNEIKITYKNSVKVRYVPSEKFVNDIVMAMKNKRMEDMKEKYRNVDVLIVDDIQFIGGKERSEEEFFHTFNTLYENNKQIILSSDRPPHTTPILEDRLRSRFSGGMIADISYPDYETRLAIVKSKLAEKNIQITDDIAELLASKIQRNIREIEGVINKILFYKEVKNMDITSKIVDEIMDKTVRQAFKNITPTQIVQVVASYFELTEKELIDHSRRKEVVAPRQITMFLLKDLLGMSYSDIGHKLGKRDHTTVIHACDKISKQMNSDQKLNNQMVLIKEIINSK